MNVSSRIGQSALAAFAAAMLTVTAVGASVGPVQPVPHGLSAAPAALVAAEVSSQASA